MKAFIKLFAFCFLIQAQAYTNKPASSRYLPSGHWLTCWGGSDYAIRKDPHFNKNSSEDEVASYIPRFTGSYPFEVKDTWIELITHSGTDCGHCGQTCTTTKQGTTCVCNSCSWQTKETAYRHWSNQKVNWEVHWAQDPNYRAMRKNWLAQGQPQIGRSVKDLDKLLLFDPERPLEYFLFPGEAETIEISNGWGGTKLTPTVSIQKARHEYSIHVNTNVGPNADCDDRDIQVSASVRTGKRIRGPTPNSIEFRKGWAVGPQNENGEFTQEPAEFLLTDISAERYEAQNIFDNYKDSRIQVELWQLNRVLWAIDGRVSSKFQVQDNLSILKWTDDGLTPPVATYDIKADDLYRTRWFEAPFHLTYNETYEVCTKVIRNNNIYYNTKMFYFFDQWSESNCSLFVYNPPDQNDLRTWGRKKRDFLSRLVGFGFF